jgi:hypothetical protein
MVDMKSSRRSDEQLESILYETANWTVNGVCGVILCEVVSLRVAIEKAAQFAAMGREVVALTRGHPSEIVVLPDQVRILTILLAEPEASRRPRVAAFINETVDDLDELLAALMPNGLTRHEVAA